MWFLYMKVIRVMVVEILDLVIDILWLVFWSFYYFILIVNWLCINVGDLSLFYLFYFYKKFWSWKCYIWIDDGFCKIWISFVLFDIYECRYVNFYYFELLFFYDLCVWVFWCWDYLCSIGFVVNLICRYFERDWILENVFVVIVWCVLEKNLVRI